MGLVRITSWYPEWGLCEYVIVHTILGGSPVILWISLGGKPKWLPLKFGYHDVMPTSPIQRKPFWPATQLYPPNDWTGWQNGVNYDVFTQAPFINEALLHPQCLFVAEQRFWLKKK